MARNEARVADPAVRRGDHDEELQDQIHREDDVYPTCHGGETAELTGGGYVAGADAHAKAELRASGLAPICLALLDAEQATRGFLGPAKEKPLRAALGQIAHGADAASPVQLV